MNSFSSIENGSKSKSTTTIAPNISDCKTTSCRDDEASIVKKKKKKIKKRDEKKIHSTLYKYRKKREKKDVANVTKRSVKMYYLSTIEYESVREDKRKKGRKEEHRGA